MPERECSASEALSEISVVLVDFVVGKERVGAKESAKRDTRAPASNYKCEKVENIYGSYRTNFILEVVSLIKEKKSRKNEVRNLTAITR